MRSTQFLGLITDSRQAQVLESTRTNAEATPAATMTRRDALRSAGVAMLATLGGGSLFAADQQLSALEKTIQKALSKGLKLPYDFYLKHPSPFFADVTLRLVMNGHLTKEKAIIAINENAQNLKVQASDRDKSITIAFDSAYLIHSTWTGKYKKEISDINIAIRLAGTDPAKAIERIVKVLEEEKGLQ